ncbi:MAG: tyrosine-type recombinase/integrase [Chthoniobacteraceae bacterium]|jgi:integrase
MNTNTEGKSRGTFALLENVAPNLFRHSENQSYWGVKKINGKRIVRALNTADRKTADGKLSEWLADLKKVDPANRDMTLAMLLEKYEAARKGLAKSTMVGEQGRITKFRESFPLPMETLVARVRNSDIAAWLGVVGQSRRASTRNQYRAFVRSLFDFAVSDTVIAKNPFDPKIIKTVKREPVIRRIPSAQEFEQIIAEIRKPTWKAVKGKRGGQRPAYQHDSADFAEFLGRAGVGQAEAAGLTWPDIDEERHVIHYRRKKTKFSFNTPIYPWLKPLLAKLRKDAGPNPRGPVFKVRDVKKALRGATDRLGLPSFTQRNLRAMRIKRLWEQGVDVKLISQWQGHRDGGTLIMNTYTETFGSNAASYERAQLEKAAAAEEAVIRGTPLTRAA